MGGEMMSKAPTTSYSVGDCERMSNEDLVAEVSRLRRLVEEAYKEGVRRGYQGIDPNHADEYEWTTSKSFRKLNSFSQ
jgi:hypothetical protein